MKIAYAIFGQRGRRIGLLALGASTLLTPARVMGGVTLTAAGIFAVVNLHPDSGATHSLAAHGTPVVHNAKLPRHTQGKDGVVDLSTSGGKLFLAMNHPVPVRGKDAGQTSGQPPSGAQATQSGFLAAGARLSAFGHHAIGAPASHSSISPAPAPSSPALPNPQGPPQVGPGPGAGLPHAALAPKKTSAPTDMSVQQPGPALDDPFTPPGNPANPGNNVGPDDDLNASPDGPAVAHADPGALHDDSNPSNDDSGDPVGLPDDLVNVPPEDPGLPSLPDTFVAPLLVTTDLPLGPGSDGDAAAPSGIAPLNVPEPASMALFGIGLLGLGWARRRHGAEAEPGF